jgi:integrase
MVTWFRISATLALSPLLTPAASSLPRNVSANRTRASLSGFYTWAMQRGLTEANPVAGTHVAPEAPRSRVLTIEELAAVWRHTGDDVRQDRQVKLLILTGCRAAEIGGLRHDEIHDGMIVLPGERVKTGRSHIIPLADATQSILSTIARGRYGDHVFARGGFRSWSYGKRQLDARLSAAVLRFEPWTIHDLRRSAATGMAEIGSSRTSSNAC